MTEARTTRDGWYITTIEPEGTEQAGQDIGRLWLLSPQPELYGSVWYAWDPVEPSRARAIVKAQEMTMQEFDAWMKTQQAG
jgi:hypothetical protein